ncbi:MAG: hypothetical protein ABIB71_08665, partial [Candidatus Woesearchaeota archaeon]
MKGKLVLALLIITLLCTSFASAGLLEWMTGKFTFFQDFGKRFKKDILKAEQPVDNNAEEKQVAEEKQAATTKKTGLFSPFRSIFPQKSTGQIKAVETTKVDSKKVIPAKTLPAEKDYIPLSKEDPFSGEDVSIAEVDLGLPSREVAMPVYRGGEKILIGLALQKYRRFQEDNTDVFEHIVWYNSEYPDGVPITRLEGVMGDLEYYLGLLEAGRPFPYDSPPEGFAQEGWHKKVYSEEDALRMYLPRVAVQLYVEVNDVVGWSITDYDDDSLSMLFDGKSFISYDDEDDYYYFKLIGSERLGGGMPSSMIAWNAFLEYEFLKSNKMIKPAAEETAYGLTEWMSENLNHIFDEDRDAIYLQYGYEDKLRVDRMLYPPEGASHWVGGCTL